MPGIVFRSRANAGRGNNAGLQIRVPGAPIEPKGSERPLHYYKDKAGLIAGDHCTFDTRTGDIIYNGEVIGNLRD
jgi:hypothetical protein